MLVLRGTCDGRTGCHMPRSRPWPCCDLVLEKEGCLSHRGQDSAPLVKLETCPESPSLVLEQGVPGEFPPGKVGNE